MPKRKIEREPQTYEELTGQKSEEHFNAAREFIKALSKILISEFKAQNIRQTNISVDYRSYCRLEVDRKYRSMVKQLLSKQLKTIGTQGGWNKAVNKGSLDFHIWHGEGTQNRYGVHAFI